MLRAADFRVGPAPAWIDAIAVGEVTAPARAGVAGLLDDHQVRVEGSTVDEYFRRVQKVVSAAGVQNASEVSVDFDPSYQRLVLHDVVLSRGAERIEQLDPAEVRVIEKEPESRDGIYDGQLTALLFLHDVRPGDVVDYSFSLKGANPLLGSRYADEYDFSVTVPTRRVRHRLLWPSARPLHLRGAAAVEHRGAVDVYTWERRNVDPVDVEDSTPDWYDPYESVQVTEYGSWAEVGKWAVDLFEPDPRSLAEVAAVAARIREQHTTRDAQIAAAIRFVQDDIRYLGIEMGRGSHQPRQPWLTLRQRYGDCKDKSFLLALLLRNFGLEAYPALVNTKLRHRLDEFLPSPFLFDHVIAQVIDRGRTLWIDATIAGQGGTLATIDTPDDERALVVREGTRALTPTVIRSRASTRIEETYTATTLEVTSTYAGRSADELRARLSSTSAAEYAKERINLFAADHPRIAAAMKPEISDDRLRNVMVVRERYTIGNLWKNGSWTYVPHAIAAHLDLPDTRIRSMPLAIDYPLDITDRVILRGAARIEALDDVKETPAFRFEQKTEWRRGDAIVTYSLRAKRDAIPVPQVADTIAAINDLDDGLGFTFESPRPTIWPWIAGVLLVVLLVASATAVAVRRHRVRSAPTPFEPAAVKPVATEIRAQ